LLDILFLIFVYAPNSLAVLSSSIRASGIVINEYSEKPVSDVSVICNDTEVFSSKSGCFFLPSLSYRPHEIIFSHADYKKKSILCSGGEPLQGMIVLLEPLDTYSINSRKLENKDDFSGFKDLLNKDDNNNSDTDTIKQIISDKNNRLSDIEKDVVRAVRKNLFTRIKAERFQRRKELMKDWFKTDDKWWKEFEEQRHQERLAKKKRRDQARKKYIDYLNESMHTEDIDTFITRLEEDSIINNVSYSGIPDKYILKRSDYKTYEYFQKIKLAEFIDEYQKNTLFASYNFGESPRNFDIYDIQKIEMGYGATLTGRNEVFYSIPDDKPDAATAEPGKELRDQKEAELKTVKIKGKVYDQKTGRGIKSAVIMVSEIYGSDRKCFFSLDKGFFDIECTVLPGDYIIEFYIPFYEYLSKPLNVRQKNEFSFDAPLIKAYR
jgi:organic radical activating enzyme